MDDKVLACLSNNEVDEIKRSVSAYRDNIEELIERTRDPNTSNVYMGIYGDLDAYIGYILSGIDMVRCEQGESH